MQAATAKRNMTEAERRRYAFRVYEHAGDDMAEARAKAKQQAAANRRAKVNLMVGVFAVFLLSMGYMLLNTQVTVIGYEINQQMAANNELANDNTRLVLEIEQATSPEKVAGFAVEHFNMVTATDESVIYYDAAAAGNTAGNIRTGMAVDQAALGFGTLEVIDEGGSESLIESIGTFLQQLTSGSGVQLGMSD
ncbi:MAG TPA: hypothetical protein IAB00_00100 [Candidatus Avidehalobacter gallistercoris]|uniref:Cell division protein FtsL n=1 Tax=Candidatus Avidehalobacter gallistercoris TaxID=2840694 RepID=A0A9D1KYS2_9FIRM|nr:hypothetical protein [Candidatus Avidehalobacter gallistercoris]